MSAGNGERHMRVLFAGGGTGGHVYMAVSVVRRLLQEDSGAQILFAGARGGMEERILPPLGFPLETFPLGGLKNVGLRRRFQTLTQLLPAYVRSRRLLRRFRPHVVVGLGGYSSGPIVLAAARAKIPVILIEPNAYPGYTNRLLERFADQIAVGFPETARVWGTKAVVTGIPIRDEFFHLPLPDFDVVRLNLLVFGGSQGSQPINRLIMEAAPRLEEQNLHVIHQTGPEHYAEVAEHYRRTAKKVEVLPYIEDMPSMFGRAHLVLSRSGASTVAEIAAAGRPAVLIPFPAAADDHQTRNAQVLADAGAAVVLSQSSLTPPLLANALLELAADRNQLRRMATAARTVSVPEASGRILDLIFRADRSRADGTERRQSAAGKVRG